MCSPKMLLRPALHEVPSLVYKTRVKVQRLAVGVFWSRVFHQVGEVHPVVSCFSTYMAIRLDDAGSRGGVRRRACPAARIDEL